MSGRTACSRCVKDARTRRKAGSWAEPRAHRLTSPSGAADHPRPDIDTVFGLILFAEHLRVVEGQIVAVRGYCDPRPMLSATT